MAEHFAIELPPFQRGIHLITNHVRKDLPLNGDGVLHLFIQHTSAALTINENADPDVRHDMELMMDRIVPENQQGLLHTYEGPDDMPAHTKSSLFGSSVSIPFSEGNLLLGTWQGIYLCEFRNSAGRRRMIATVMR
ncbi:MAG: secondary thiamine-phosphate synthase enzyme YjbQ [Flavobacteriales bacterium]|nr:secondary thiamine-phosphate synthase enzyme YjbQ [Flavobacteriales bacterium]